MSHFQENSRTDGRTDGRTDEKTDTSYFIENFRPRLGVQKWSDDGPLKTKTSEHILQS